MLLTEIDVPNLGQELSPGLYCTLELSWTVMPNAAAQGWELPEYDGNILGM
jgi:hypothetical protein